MQEAPANPQPGAPTTRGILLRIWLGIFLYGLLNIPFMVSAAAIATGLGVSSSGLAAGAIFALLVGLLAALTGLLLRWRIFTAGFLGGYALMTIVSAGSCTLLTQDTGFGEWALPGLLLYSLAVIVLGVGLAIAGAVAAARR